MKPFFKNFGSFFVLFLAAFFLWAAASPHLFTPTNAASNRPKVSDQTLINLSNACRNGSQINVPWHHPKKRLEGEKIYRNRNPRKKIHHHQLLRKRYFSADENATRMGAGDLCGKPRRQNRNRLQRYQRVRRSFDGIPALKRTGSRRPF